MKKALMAVVFAALAGGVSAAEFKELGAKASDIAVRAATDPVEVKPVASQVKEVVLRNAPGASNKNALTKKEPCGETVIHTLRSCIVAPPVCVKMQSYTNDPDLRGYSAWYTVRTYKLAISPNGQTNQFITEEPERILAGNIPSHTYPDTPESWAKLKDMCEQGVGIVLAELPVCK